MLNILPVRGQNTEGTEFWLTFGRINGYSPTLPNMQIRIVGGMQVTSVNIYFTNLGLSEKFDINPYEIYTYSLNNTQKEAVCNTTTGITNFSVYITTSEPVTVYAYNGTPSQSEATHVLPVTTLGTEYYYISYTVSGYLPDAYAIVATQNNTQIQHNKEPPIPLNAGEVYYRTSTTDMTGAKITSNNPVALFALHQGVGFLSGVPFKEQMAPVNTWGKTFFVPVTVTGSDYVRIVAANNNTNISQIGGLVRTDVPGAQTTLTNLQAGEFVELDINIINNGCYIFANNPIGVCAYLKQQSGAGFHSIPSQVWIPGIEQKVTKALISPFLVANSNYQAHFALILTPTATRDDTKVSIGDLPPTDVSGGSWVANTIAGMSFYSMPLDNSTASYIFTNPQGVIILGYMVSNTNLLQSYYYLAYSAMRDLDAAFYANNVHFQDLEENPFCENEIEFRAELDNMSIDADSIKWYINGVEYEPAQNHLEWNKIFPNGEYEIKMWVRFENDDTISKTGILKIKTCGLNAEFYVNGVHYENLQNTTVCTEDVVIFRAEIEGLNPNPGSLKWYIDGVEEEEARDKLVWSKPLPNGEYDIEMWVLFENDQDTTIESTLKVEVFWVKIKNVKY